MPQDHRTAGSDDVARAVFLATEAGRQSLDWAALARVVAEHRHERLERRRDRAVGAGWRVPDAADDDAFSLDPPVADPEVLAIKLNGVLIASMARFARAWQRLIEDQAPAFRQRLEDVQSVDDPSPDARAAVIAQIRALFQDMGSLARDQANLFEFDLWKLQEDLLPREPPSRWRP